MNTLVIAAAGAALFASSLDTKLIDEVVRGKRDAISDCYNEGLARKPRLAGKIVVLFTVEADGIVSDAVTKKGTTLKDDAVVNCVLGEMKTLVFPAVGGDCDVQKEDCSVKITYPFTFTP